MSLDVDSHRVRLLADPRLAVEGPGFIYHGNATREVPRDARDYLDGAPAHMLTVALRTADTISGLLSVDNLVSGRPIRVSDAPPLVAFANALAVALENVTLLEERAQRIDALDAHVRRQVGELEWLCAISQRLNGAVSLDEVLDIVYDGIRQGLGYDRVGIMTFDHDRGEYEECRRDRSGAGRPMRAAQRSASLAADSPIWRLPDLAACWAGRPSITPMTPWPRRRRSCTICSTAHSQQLAVPVRAGRTVSGMICVDNLLSGEPITPAHAGPLMALANGVGLAIEKARLQDRERVERLEVARGADRLRALYATMACGVLVRAANGRISDANEAAQEILGQPLEHLRGSLLADTLAETEWEDGTPVAPEERPVPVAFRTGRPNAVRLGALRADGQHRRLQVDAVPMQEADGTPGAVVVTFVDITARKQAEDAARQSEARLSVLLASARALTSTLDRDHILQALARCLVEALHARGAAFTQVDLQARRVTSLAHYSAPGQPSIFSGGSRDLEAFPVLERVLRTRTLFHGCNDDPTFPQSERAYLERWAMQAELLVPVVVQGEAVGVLDLYWDQPPRRRMQETIAVCTAIAEQAAMALEHASLYADAASVPNGTR